MFEVGFSEILMVALVALLVLGPEKLPKAARVLGFWLGKARTTIATVKMEIEHEFHAEEMRQLGKENVIAKELDQVIKDTEAAINEMNVATQPLPDAKTGPHDDKPA